MNAAADDLRICADCLATFDAGDMHDDGENDLVCMDCHHEDMLDRLRDALPGATGRNVAEAAWYEREGRFYI